MNRPDRSLNQSLTRLHDTAPEIIKWFLDSLDSQKDVNIDLDGDKGIRGQGRAEELREIVQFIMTAPESIKKTDLGESPRTPRSTKFV